MTDSMKFGPEWLRNMNSDSSPLVLGSSGGGGGGGSSSNSAATNNNVAMVNDTAPIIMAKFRYGREEMLLLFNRCNVPPDPLKTMQGLYVEKKQMPINLITLTEEETRMWNRGINSDAALRMAKPGSGPGTGMPGTRGALPGRGGSVDRGRGRARGSYHYSRGLSYEDSEPSNGFNNRGMRSYDRTQGQGNWSERNGGDSTDYTATSPRKEFSSRSFSDTNWRRHRSNGEDEDTWRNSRSDKWGRGSSNSWRESDNNWDRSNHNNHPPQKKPWEGEENNLPEWATENPSESGGSFDASGAFHGGSTYSDEDEGEGHPRSESTKHNTTGTSQPRPASYSKKEPPNIPNGNSADTSSTSTTPLKQSQSATSLSSERRPTNHHPITTSASFSEVDMRISQTSRDSKPTQREDVQKPAPVSHQPPAPVQQPTEAPPPAPAPPIVESKVVTKTSQEEEIEQRLLDAADVFVSKLMDEEDKDPPNTISSAATPPTSAATPTHPHTLNDSLWYYQDPQGNVQGPFQSPEMVEWFNTGYFNGNLMVRRALDERYSPLKMFMKLWKDEPFTLDYYQLPPIKNTEPVKPIIDENLLLQVQLQQQQRLLMQRTQALAKINQADHFTNLTVEQQQMLLHQAQLELSLQASLMNSHAHTQSQQPQPHTNANVVAMIHQLAQFQQHPQARAAPQVTIPVPNPSETPPDPVRQLMQQMGLQSSTPRPSPSPSEPDQRSIEQFMNVFRQRQANPHTMESGIWGGTNTAQNFPGGWAAPPGHSTNLPQSLWVDPVAKGIKTEQEVLEEQLRAEEKKREEIRRQEELQRIKEEEERQRRLKEEEELERRRKEEKEKEREKERKRMQEEEDRKKKEAAAAKKAEQDRLRKEEEKKRKEEEKRRKEEEKRKQEEEKKRAEEEKKRQEEEKRKREEMTKRQNEALKRLEQQQQQQARAAKPAPVPWTTPETAGASLADIQKTERKQQQQLREQQEMFRAYQEKHLQEQQLKNANKSLNLKWADTASKNQATRVKSLAEIQAEEHERMAKQAEKEKAERIAAAKDIPISVPGSIWTTAPQSSWNSAWGMTAVSGSGSPRSWDEVSAKATKPQQAASTVANKSQAKTKAKKEEASVMKLFEKQLPKTFKNDEFNRWCTKMLAVCNSTLDTPTFVEFLLSIESQKEVREYIILSLGNTQEANNFASEFIERRSRLFSVDQPLARPEPPPPTHSNNFQEVKGKNKKVKKGKMTKVDSRILGFSVTSAPDRINVGDRDYGEGS